VTTPHAGRRGHARTVLVAALALGLTLAGCDSGSSETPARPKPLPTVVPAACAGTLRRSTPGTLQSPDLKETSGLAVSAKNPGTLWVNNDSGDTARVFAVSPEGVLRGISPLEGATAIDWEDIAIGPAPPAKTPFLYVGDIGDNGAARPNIVVYRVAEPKVIGDGSTTPLTGVDALTFTYPDGPHDAEALMVDPRSGEIYIIIKQLAGGPAAVYRAPAGLTGGSTTMLTKVGEISLPRGPLVFAVTASDISRDGRVIGVRTYGGVRLWKLAPKQTVMGALAAKPCDGPIPLEPQGESIGLKPDGRGYFTVSEGVNAPLHQFLAPKPTQH
jgi:hypothetical protein